MAFRLEGSGRTRHVGRFAKLRRLWQVLCTVDLQELYAQFEARQRRLEHAQFSTGALLAETAAKVDGILRTRSAAPPLISALELGSDDRFELEARCRMLANAAYLGDDTVLCRVLGSHKLYLDTRDTGFASHVLLDGYWEMWLTIFFARHVKPGMTVIDVGANYGYYTLLFGALVGGAGHVFAIEPNPVVMPKLRRSVGLNGLAGRTTIIEAAAGAREDGDVTLFVPHGEPKNGAVITAPETVALDSGSLYQVPLIRLDSLAPTVPRVDLVKIDAEGAEQDIISGMEGILRRDRPGLLLEFNALRYIDAAGFLEKLAALYRRMRYVDFNCDAKPVSVDQLLRDRSGEDWLLYFDWPPEEALS